VTKEGNAKNEYEKPFHDISGQVERPSCGIIDG
jgi:hypothetical protein